MTLASKLQDIANHVALDPRDGEPRLTLRSRLSHVGPLCSCGSVECRNVGCPSGPQVGSTDEVLFILSCWACSDRGCVHVWSFTVGDLAGDPLGLLLLNSPGSWQNIIDRLEATPFRERLTSWDWLLSDDSS